MACFLCVAYRRESSPDSGSTAERLRQEKGQCTLNPVWLEVAALHYCQQFRSEAPALHDGWAWGDYKYRSSSRQGNVLMRMHVSQEAEDKQRQLRIAAEKKLKDVRAQKRALEQKLKDLQRS